MTKPRYLLLRFPLIGKHFLLAGILFSVERLLPCSPQEMESHGHTMPQRWDLIRLQKRISRKIYQTMTDGRQNGKLIEHVAIQQLSGQNMSSFILANVWPLWQILTRTTNQIAARILCKSLKNSAQAAYVVSTSAETVEQAGSRRQLWHSKMLAANPFLTEQQSTTTIFSDG